MHSNAVCDGLPEHVHRPPHWYALVIYVFMQSLVGVYKRYKTIAICIHRQTVRLATPLAFVTRVNYSRGRVGSNELLRSVSIRDEALFRIPTRK